MALLLDTRTVAPEHRRDAWAEVHAHALFPLSIDFANGHAFTGRADGAELGPMGMLRFRGDASTVRRTPQTIRAADPDHLVVALSLDGACAVEQGGRASVLRRGDLTTWASSRPFRVPHAGRFDLLLLSVPVQELGVRPRETAHRVPGTGGPGLVAAAFLRELWLQLEHGSLDAGDPDLQDAVLAIARAMLRGPGGVNGPVPVPPAALAATVRAHAERHLGDPRLGPAMLAAAHHVSLRYLHGVFAAEGETVAAWIRRRRLEEALTQLRDPALAHIPISRIADRWGFVSHAHFSRAFRAAYGFSPREARRPTAR